MSNILFRSLIGILLLYSAQSIYAKPVLLVMGDSLSAAYRLNSGEGWVNLMAKRMQAENYIYKIVNASTSGATTSDGLRRLPQLLQEYKPAIIIIALGSNDGLRGIALSVTSSNLGSMIKESLEAKSKVLLIGFHLPYNYGDAFRKQFAAIYPDLSDEYDVSLVPFLLEGFANDLNYFQDDQLHPTAKAQPLILDNVWPHLKPLL